MNGNRIKLLLMALVLLVTGIQPALAQGTPSADYLRQFNRRRLLNGLAPLALSPALERAAQRHADDMARRGVANLGGSDGSDTARRVLESGFREWATNRRVATELVYRGSNFEEALDFLLADTSLRRNLFDGAVREVGIGGAKNGAVSAFSIIVGAQPNVLPVFINDGASATNSAEVSVRVSQELINTDAEQGAITRIVDVRLSNDSGFAGAEWMPYEPIIPFTLKGPGENSVHVEFRDAVGRRVTSVARIVLDPNARPEAAIGLGEPIVESPEPDTAASATPAPTATRVQPLIAVATLARQGSGPAPSATPNQVEATPLPAFPAATRVLQIETPSPSPGTTVARATPPPVPSGTAGDDWWKWLLLAQIAFAGVVLVRVLRSRG